MSSCDPCLVVPPPNDVLSVPATNLWEVNKLHSSMMADPSEKDCVWPVISSRFRRRRRLGCGGDRLYCCPYYTGHQGSLRRCIVGSQVASPIDEPHPISN